MNDRRLKLEKKQAQLFVPIKSFLFAGLIFFIIYVALDLFFKYNDGKVFNFVKYAWRFFATGSICFLISYIFVENEIQKERDKEERDKLISYICEERDKERLEEESRKSQKEE